MRLLVLFSFMLYFNGYSQMLFPLIKINHSLSFINIIDSSLYKEFNFDSTLFLEESILLKNESIQPCINQTLEIGSLGKVIIPLRGNPNYGFSFVKSNLGLKIYTCNRNVDTLIIDSSLFVEVNPFPNIYCKKVKVYFESEEETTKSFDFRYVGISTYNLFSNGNLASAAICNNEFGSVKFFWNERGDLIAKGAFKENMKNGFWYYYGTNNKLKCTQLYNEGKLIWTKGNVNYYHKNENIINW